MIKKAFKKSDARVESSPVSPTAKVATKLPPTYARAIKRISTTAATATHSTKRSTGVSPVPCCDQPLILVNNDFANRRNTIKMAKVATITWPPGFTAPMTFST